MVQRFMLPLVPKPRYRVFQSCVALCPLERVPINWTLLIGKIATYCEMLDRLFSPTWAKSALGWVDR